MSPSPQKDADQLVDQAHEYLADGDYEAALKVAQQLEGDGESEAFAIAAEAHAAQGNVDEAVKVLQRGVEVQPDCWSNWQMLGNYRSDLGQQDKANEAYEKALACSDAWTASIRLNRAILAARDGNYDEALRELDSADDEELRLELASARIQVLQEAGRLDEALEAAAEAMQWEYDPERDGPCLARIVAMISRVQMQQGRHKDGIRRRLLDALEWADHSNPEVLAAIRDLDGRYSPDAQYFRLELSTRLLESDDETGEADTIGLFVEYDVVAESVEQAIGWIGDFEPEISRDAWTVESSEAIEPRPDEPMGVYWRACRVEDAND
jgi:tetratricopeptide (TPR) repeat protein